MRDPRTIDAEGRVGVTVVESLLGDRVGVDGDVDPLDAVLDREPVSHAARLAGGQQAQAAKVAESALANRSAHGDDLGVGSGVSGLRHLVHAEVRDTALAIDHGTTKGMPSASTCRVLNSTAASMEAVATGSMSVSTGGDGREHMHVHT